MGSGAELEGLTVVIHAEKVSDPGSQNHGDYLEVCKVQTLPLILLDCLAEADGQLLAGIGGDSLGSVGHERVGQSLVDDIVDE